MESEIDLLRQENARLTAKITGLEVENADVKAMYGEAMDEIVKLKAELKSRIEELEKGRTDTVAENARRDDAIAELKAEVVKLRDDNEEGKWQTPEVINVPSSTVDQLDNSSEVLSKSTVQFSCVSEEKTPEDKKTDAFLNEVHKKGVSEEIRQRNREKKLQHEALSQEVHSISQNTASTTSTTSHG